MRASASHRFVVTAGLASLSGGQFASLLSALRCFSDFTSSNDFHGEHCEGQQYLWKIDCSDPMMAPTLTGVSALDNGLIHMMSKRAEQEMLDPISVYFHHTTPGLGRMLKSTRMQLGLSINAIKHLTPRSTLTRFTISAVSRRSVFSMADITLIGGLIFAELLKLPVPDELSALKFWYARMQECPSVKNRVAMSEPSVQ